MGVAYRELIGSLYESWTIGIERVYKKLINSLIQQCQKCQKWGFEAKERESSPRPSPKERGCNDEERVTNDGGNMVKTSRWLPSKGEMQCKSDN